MQSSVMKKGVAVDKEATRKREAVLAATPSSEILSHTPEVKQEFSTVNSTQLVLENPDAYDEIQSRFNEFLQQKGDLEKTLHAEAQKHREDLRMWEYEVTVLERLWKQSEKDVNRLEQAPAESSDRMAEVIDELKDAWDESHREYVKLHEWIEKLLRNWIS